MSMQMVLLTIDAIQVVTCVIHVAMLLHNGQVGSLPPSGRPPTRQVSPAGYMFP